MNKKQKKKNIENKNFFYPVENKKEMKKYFNKLTQFHFKNCKPYSKLLSNLNYNPKVEYSLQDLPYIPVRLFKEFELYSVKKKNIFKVLNSSGTSGLNRSKIYLDKQNSKNQIFVLNKIMTKILGNERLPMLIIDQNLNKINKKNFNARVAAINGFSIFGKNHTFLLNENNKINYKLLNLFLEKYSNKKFLIFGFTSLIYEHFIKKINKKKIDKKLNNGILLHGGGWKKLENLNVTNKEFKNKLYSKLLINNVYNYYGMIEQTGSIFLECKCGFFVTSEFSDIFIRNDKFNLAKKNEKGFIQLLSLLPTSYPGHNILTEDIGQIIDDKKCKCNIDGKKFLVHGRVAQAEIRGCSDV